MHLQDNDYTFYCKVQGEKSKEWFEGNFTVKSLLNQEEMVDVAIRTDRYNGGSKNLPTQHALINRAIAELEVRIVKDKKTNKMLCPTWWTESDFGRLLYDTNVVYHVFAEAMKAEDNWYKKLTEKSEAIEKQAKDNPKEAQQ